MGLLAMLAIGILAVAVTRGLALREDEILAERLGHLAAQEAAPFDPASLASLPEPVRRYLARSIAPGTPIVQVARLRLEGRLLLDGQSLDYTADEILAAPQGLLWRADLGSGMQALSASVGYGMAREGSPKSWTRISKLGVFPMVRQGGTADHARLVAGRALIEALWLPAALTPQAGAMWRQTGPDSAEVRFPDLPDLPPMALTFDPEGLPLTARTERLSDGSAEGGATVESFAARFSNWAQFGGYTIPITAEFGPEGGAPNLTANVIAAEF